MLQIIDLIWYVIKGTAIVVFGAVCQAMIFVGLVCLKPENQLHFPEGYRHLNYVLAAVVVLAAWLYALAIFCLARHTAVIKQGRRHN